MLQITVTADEDSGLCPIRNVLARVCGKWQSLILLSLEDDPQRFNQIKRLVGDISQRVLTENLRSLERDGYVTRQVHPGPPLAVSYQLTTLGEEFIEVWKPLVAWAGDSFDQVIATREAFDSNQA